MVNMGTPPQRALGYNFSVDTSSSTLVTTAAECKDCILKSYNSTESKTDVNVTGKPEKIWFNGGILPNVTGFMMKD